MKPWMPYYIDTFLSFSPMQQQMGIDQSDDSSEEGSEGEGLLPNGFIIRRADLHGDGDGDDVMDSDDDDGEGGGRGSFRRCTHQ